VRLIAPVAKRIEMQVDKQRWVEIPGTISQGTRSMRCLCPTAGPDM